ncbi:MAG: CBS domain-containing protein [Candidatus Thorarchaeota archaeon]|nr:MAG: CBS domain-containing protein [Candidatus Thorarchaeota archaeon]
MADALIVKDVMTKEVKVTGPDSNVKEVVAAMNKFDIGSIIVVQDNKPVGVISERDVLRRVVEPCLSPETIAARQIMTHPVITIHESASLTEAVRIMAEKRVRKIPVMKKKKLVGIITYTDILSKGLNMISILGELTTTSHTRSRKSR